MSKAVRLWGAVAIAVISWGESWVSIRAAVAHFAPGQLAFGRYFIASLVLLPLLIRNRPRFERRDWLPIFISGVCGFSLYNLALNAGELTISAGAAALVGSIIPVLVTLGASLFLKHHVSRRALLGAGVSFSGVALLSLGGRGGIHVSTGALLVVCAAFCAATYQLIQVRLRPRYGALDLTAAAIIGGTVALFPFSGGLIGAIRAAPPSATLHMIGLGVFPGALGYVLWSWALSRMSVARVMSFLFLISPCAVLMGWFFLGELPSTLELCGGALALSGVIWCQTERK